MPGVGYRHSDSTLTAFYDGRSASAGRASLRSAHVKQDDRSGHPPPNEQKIEPYRGTIWEHESEVDLLDPSGMSRCLDDDIEPPPACLSLLPASASASRQVYSKHSTTTPTTLTNSLTGQKLNGEIPWEAEDFQPAHATTAITDPEKHEGLEFPADWPCTAGWATSPNGTNAFNLDGFTHRCWSSPPASTSRTPTTMFEPMSMARSSAESTRARMYIWTWLWPIHPAFPTSESVVMEDAPGSHSGLMNQLSEEEPVHRLLFLGRTHQCVQRLRHSREQPPCHAMHLWNKDKAGGSVKKGRQAVYGKLSMLGGLAINDAADFARVFRRPQRQGAV